MDLSFLPRCRHRCLLDINLTSILAEWRLDLIQRWVLKRDKRYSSYIVIQCNWSRNNDRREEFRVWSRELLFASFTPFNYILNSFKSTTTTYIYLSFTYNLPDHTYIIHILNYLTFWDYDILMNICPCLSKFLDKFKTKQTKLSYEGQR